MGDSYDEHDDISEEMVPVDSRTWQVDGRMQLSELCERLGIADRYEAETAGGWASEVLGYIPSVGAAFDCEGLHCVVTGMDRRRVARLRIRDDRTEPEKES